MTPPRDEPAFPVADMRVNTNALRALRDAGTPGEWDAIQDDRDALTLYSWPEGYATLIADFEPSHVHRPASDPSVNAALIAAAVNALIPLCDTIDAQAAEIARLRDALTEIVGTLEAFGNEVNWGASALSAETIMRVNAVPSLACAALNGEAK